MADYHQHYKDEILNIAITGTILIVAVTPLYFYGFLKCRQFQYHVMVQRRFPLLTGFIILTPFVGTITAQVNRWIQCSDFNYTFLLTSAAGLSYFTYVLINIRLFFVYRTFRNNQLKQTTKDTKSLANSQQNHYRHWFVIAYLIFSFIMVLYVSLAGNRPEWIMVFSLGWVSNFIVTIVLSINMCYHRVNDGIGCMRETNLILFVTFLAFMAGSLQQISSLIAAITYSLTILSVFRSLMSLYCPLYYIYQFEGTLDQNVWKSEQRNKMFVRHAMNVESSDIVIGSKSEDKTEENNVLSQTALPLSQFLDSEIRNYNMFSAYLAFCWSLENILFVERASVLYQIISKCRSKDTPEENKDENKLYRFKFKYLQPLYTEYQKIIDDSVTDDSVDSIESLQQGFNKILVSICTEFVKTGAVNEINISYQTRTALLYIVNGNFEKLVSFNDYLNVFNDCLTEIYQLMISMYQYQFVKYAQKHY